jgi:hypothetical protein
VRRRREHLIGAVLDDLLHERVLAVEVVVEARLAHPELGGELAQ